MSRETPERRYAEVVLTRDHPRFHRPFTYTVPDSLVHQVELGSRVWVPLGKQHLEGYVVGFTAASDLKEIKPIEQVLGEGPVFSAEQVGLARWMADYYLCPLIRVLRAMLPPTTSRGARHTVELVELAEDEWTEVLFRWEELHPPAARLLAYLKKNGETPVGRLARLDPEHPKTLEALISQGLVLERIHPPKQRSPRPSRPPEPAGEAPAGPPTPVLNPEQQNALDEICRALESPEKAPVLLHGVTASGKTEIYLQAVERVLEKGRGAIVLVPEIALTPQLTSSFRQRFGEKVAVLHSRLTGRERRQEWNRLREGLASIAIGARSAVFAPVQSLGLIVLDEEHETSYKQDSQPRYHCREVAEKRAEIAGALLVMGSATPSLESYHRAEQGEYRLVELTRRVESRPLPPVQVVDLREELREGNRSIFSRRLQESLRRTWEKGEQAILFLNRRGFATFVVCRQCGFSLRCLNCDVAYTYHQAEQRLRCHYCDRQRPMPSRCPGCGSSFLRQFGLGTQRVEEEARRLLPRARIVRIDLDTLKKSAEDLAALNRGEWDLLIGTQLVAKGLDFPRVTLVGVVTADISLNLPDFRCGERTFQLLTQVAGRAGRGEQPGEVIVQTYFPQHYSLLTASGHDYRSFYRAELQYRQRWYYPPFCDMIRILVAGPAEYSVRSGAELLGRYLEAGLKPAPGNAQTAAAPRRPGPVLLDPSPRHPEPILLGPAPAPLSQLRGQYRWQLVLKGRLEQLQAAVKKGLSEFQAQNPASRLTIAVDVQPWSML